MELHQLRYFTAAAEAGSISRAAARVGVAQPSLSQQIAKLERELGAPLFDRVGRGVVLTETGRALLPRARRILADVRALGGGLASAEAAGGGQLAIGAIPTIAPYVLPALVARIGLDLPGASVHVREDLTDHLLDALADHEIELAVVSRPADHPLVELETVCSEALVAAVPDGHPLSVKDAVSVSDLRSHDAVSLDRIHCLGQQIEGLCASRRIARPVVCESMQLSTLLEFVRRGVGIAIVPAMVAVEPYPGVGFVPLTQRDAKRDLVIARRVGRTRSSISERFSVMLKDHLRGGRPDGLNGA